MADIQKIIKTFNAGKASYLKIQAGGEFLELVKANPVQRNVPVDKVNQENFLITKLLHEVKSSNIGRYELLASENFVEGQKVELGDILGDIVSVGITHPVLSPCAGSIQKVCVNQGDTVEFGQVLFLIQEGKHE